MASVFISYSRRNESVIRSLVTDIEALGHDVWFDQELSGGQVWWDQILDRIRGCDAFVFAVAPSALESTACKREADYADDLGKPVLPILVEDGVSTNLLPTALSKIQFVDYRSQDRVAALSLGRAFSSLPPADPLPKRLPTPPDAPISYLATLAERVSAAAALDYEDQSSLIIDLKRGLRDPETADDSRTLLTRLRKRDDLFAKVAEEIDELLEVQGEAELAEPSRTFVGNQPADQVSPQHTERDLERSGQSGMGIKSRSALDCAVLGGILGLVAGILALAYEGDLADVWFFSIVPTVGGAIAGAMTRQHRVPIFASLAMAFAVSILSVAYEVGTTDLVGIAVIFGAPIGAVIGAIAGTRIRKWRDVPHPAQ